ncbi:hypothetical protein OIU84_004654 [Salix udensis]|uniref:Pentatricopeptide repeat-containing protein n=1 Tax=Salix udensis TaxID=889485 RepID=A0AAD6K2Z6_9ROSI|nr:hypothetical protein OIU84_004654 [Salix udensis]
MTIKDFIQMTLPHGTREPRHTLLLISPPHNQLTTITVNPSKISNTLLQTNKVILIRVMPILTEEDILNNNSNDTNIQTLINGVKIIPSTKTLVSLALVSAGIMGNQEAQTNGTSEIRDTRNRETLTSGAHVWSRRVERQDLNVNFSASANAPAPVTAPQYPNPNQRDQNYPQYPNPNQRDQNHPQYQNPGQFSPNVRGDYGQPGSPNRWDHQNQGYPQKRNTDQWASHVGPESRRQDVNVNFSVNANVPAPATAPPPSVNDLERLCQEGKVKQAIELMDNGVKASANCFHSLFEMCSKHEDAKKVHDYFLQSTFRGDVKLNNKVIKMYGKCGSMADARRVFDHMPDRNMDSWHLMINECANNDLGDEGLELFEQMKKLGLEPTGETFQAVLSACASAESVEEGFLYFEEMSREFGISPTLDHYLGIIDVLGKSAYLNEAVEYIEKLPFEPTVEIWEALRRYARSHGDIDLEDHSEELIVSFDSSKAAANKIPTPPPKKYNLISMLEGKNRVTEFRNPTLYKDDEKLKELQNRDQCSPDCSTLADSLADGICCLLVVG